MDKMPGKKFSSIGEYHSSFPEKEKKMLDVLRNAIRNAAPGAEEVISYNMPAFRYHGILVYYAAHKEHIGFYPGNILFREIFKEELSSFETSKGTIRFPLNREIPVSLVEGIIRFRVIQNEERAAKKRPGTK